MPKTKSTPVSELTLDLKNFRTVPQKNEVDALHAMLSIAPEKFWALTESLLDDGYLPTENIIVLDTGKQKTVKEGNRRIGALKLAFGLIKRQGLGAPDNVEEKISKLSKVWQEQNKEVPCAIYDASEADVVDHIVTLAHGKGEAAGRDNWKSVARARHNREKNGASEPALDLLEKYLNANKGGKNLTQEQRERWAGDYPLSVLEDAIKRIAPRLVFASARELADGYPDKVRHRTNLDNILRDIGVEILGFKEIRSTSDDFQIRYGIPAPIPIVTPPASVATTTPPNKVPPIVVKVNVPPAPIATKQPVAVSTNDPKHVIGVLKKFVPRGTGRAKLVTLLEEARTLNIEKQPHCFCFLFRSMFEISAKAYCHDFASAGLTTKKPTGEDKHLVNVLREITDHLSNKQDKNHPMTKVLHGAMTELATPNGVLSVTSMNQLVHNPQFVIDSTKIGPLFTNIFPLLDAMNR